MSAPATQPTLRPYQEQAVQACVDALSKSVNPLLVAPTGAGKTVMACELMRRWQTATGLACYFFAHREELISQAQYAMDRFGIKGKAVSVFKKEYPDEEYPGRANALCVFDEAHHAVASSWANVGKHFLGKKVAITATPDRLDNQRLESAGFTQVFQIEIRQLIADGFLVRPLAQKLPVSICDNIIENYDDAIEEVARSVIHEFKRFNRKRAMVFLPSVEASRRFSAELRNQGMESSHLDGTSGKLRTMSVQDFKDGATQFMCNVSLFTEGFDCPEVDCVVLLRETKSRALWSQMIGRGLRSSPGKTDCLILDPMWVSGIHCLQPGDAFTAHPESRCKPRLGTSDPLGEAEMTDQDAEQKLLEKIKRIEKQQAKEEAKNRGLLDLSIVTPLFGFTPPPTEAGEPMTDWQKNLLERFQIYAPADLPKAHAEYIIQKMYERQRLGLATAKQVRKLRQFGHKRANTYTVDQASKAIGSDWRISGSTRARKIFR
jgi:superfamily II DNA or RNA helicase